MCIWTLSHDLVSLHLGHLRFWPGTVLWVYDDNDTIPCVMSINNRYILKKFMVVFISSSN
jgi:hypothetical protein